MDSRLNGSRFSEAQEDNDNTAEESLGNDSVVRYTVERIVCTAFFKPIGFSQYVVYSSGISNQEVKDNSRYSQASGPRKVVKRHICSDRLVAPDCFNLSQEV
jgi:hypothetical protein